MYALVSVPCFYNGDFFLFLFLFIFPLLPCYNVFLFVACLASLYTCSYGGKGKKKGYINGLHIQGESRTTSGMRFARKDHGPSERQNAYLPVWLPVH